MRLETVFGSILRVPQNKFPGAEFVEALSLAGLQLIDRQVPLFIERDGAVFGNFLGNFLAVEFIFKEQNLDRSRCRILPCQLIGYIKLILPGV